MSTSKVNGLPGGESQREQSHAVKAGSVGRCVRRAALRDLRDMAKAILLEPQFPVMNLTIPRYRIYTARPSVLFKAVFVEQGSLDRWTAANEPLNGMKRVPKSRECFLSVNDAAISSLLTDHACSSHQRVSLWRGAQYVAR